MAVAGNSYTIESLARGLAVLRSYSPSKYEMSLADIAQSAHVTKATAFRIAHTLAEEGFLIRIDETKLYRLGPAAVSVGLETISSMTLPTIAEPFLGRLRSLTGETVQLAIPDNGSAVIVGRYPSRRFPPTTVYIGHRVPIYAGSLGRAMLSAMEPSECSTFLEGREFLAATPKSLVTTKAILQSVATASQRGWALNDQETTLEHRSLAAPIVSPTGRSVGSVNVTVSAQRLSGQELVRRHADAVMETARDISELLPEYFAGRQYVN